MILCFDARAAQVGLEAGRFVHWCRLGKGRDEHVCKVAIAQTWQQLQHLFGLRSACLPAKFPMVSFARVEQQKRVPGRMPAISSVQGERRSSSSSRFRMRRLYGRRGHEAAGTQRVANGVFGRAVVAVTAGQATLYEAINQAMRHWGDKCAFDPLRYGQHLRLASVSNDGARFPSRNRRRGRRQVLPREERLPDLPIACVGGSRITRPTTRRWQHSARLPRQKGSSPRWGLRMPWRM